MKEVHDRRYYRTKRVIRETFEDLIKKKPIDKITVTDLMERADLDRRTFYNHYGSVFDIAEEINREALEHFKEEISRIEVNETDTFFSLLSKIMLENFEYYKAVLTGTDSYQLAVDCKEILKAGIWQFYYESSGLPEDEFDYYAEYIASGVTWEYIYWLRKEDDLDVGWITEMVKRSVLKSAAIIPNGETA